MFLFFSEGLSMYNKMTNENADNSATLYLQNKRNSCQGQNITVTKEDRQKNKLI